MSGSVFDQHSPLGVKAAQQPEVTPQEEAQRAAEAANKYDAFKRGTKRQSRILIYFMEERVAIMSYSYLLEVAFSARPYHHLISLLFTNCIIKLQGRNLDQLLAPMQAELVRYLRCYNPDLYPEPPENEAVILKLWRESVHATKKPQKIAQEA